MSSERKAQPAPPHRRTSFGTMPGSRNRGFGSSDPERQRQAPDPADAASRSDGPQDAQADARGAGRARADDAGGSG